MRSLFPCLLILLMLLGGPAAVSAEAQDTIGDATDQPAATESAETGITSGEAFIRKLIQGGWTMFFLLLTSVVGVAVAIERLLRLKRSVIVPLSMADEADKLWRSGQHDELRKRADASNSTLGRIVVSLVRHKDSAAADVSAMAGDIASRDLRRHLQRAYPLLVVATIAPLLGLLGTVIGMIGAFATIEALGEMANPAAFGGDISKALITTGAGLGIAVPALAAYHYFKSRTNALGVELEEVASELISEWFVLSGSTASPARPHTDAERSASSGPQAPHVGTGIKAPASSNPTMSKPDSEAPHAS